MHYRKIRFAGMFLLAAGLLSLMATARAYAINNSPQGVIKHVIIVIQENRTPDNLFYADDILFANGGNVRPPNPSQVKYHYADFLAPDAPSQCGPTQCPYSLSDFFDFTQSHSFTPIIGAKYQETCFHNPDQPGCFPGFRPVDPDDEAERVD